MLRSWAFDFPGSWEEFLPLVEFSNNSYQATIEMAPYEALYGMKCRSLMHWDEAEEKKYLGPDLVEQASEVIWKIRQQIKTVQSRQKSYADKRRRPLEFVAGDKVFLKTSPVKGVMLFRQKDKLSPRYVGPFEILKKAGKVAYRLALPLVMSGLHDVFHMSMLRKYVLDPTQILMYPEVEIKQLRNKAIPLVKVKCEGHFAEKVTWEQEDEIREKYPTLLKDSRTKI